MRLFREKRNPIFSDEQTQELVNAIKEAELNTSGEIRVYVERHCKYVKAIDRAIQIFEALQMEQTKLRNGVLFYVAVKDKQIAIYADKGIHELTGAEYWQQVLDRAVAIIKVGNIVSGLANAIRDVGISLQDHFPYNEETDKNELPDNIVFGN